MKKFKNNKGYVLKNAHRKVKVCDKRSNSEIREERIFINREEEPYIILNGKFTSNGVENWCYKLDNFKKINDMVMIPEFLPFPNLKLKNSEIFEIHFN